MTWTLIAIAVACIQLVVAEIFDWFPWVSVKIIRFAAGSLPDRFRARWEAEWLAELDAVPGKSISKILFALSVLRGVPRLRVTLDPSAPRSRSLVGARTSDIAIAASSLFLLLPALLLIALLIRIAAGPGPILYRARRIGPNGETLMLFAFRTNFARPGADQRPSSFATWLSTLLRVSSVDMLPRMINVLRGDLSLVGPPPAFPSDREIESIGHAKAGIVSWRVLIADEEEARRRDLAYHMSWSLAKLFEAMWRTVRETFRGQPASGGR